MYGQNGTNTYFNLDCMRHFKNFVANASTYGSNVTFKLNTNISLSGKWSPIEKFSATLDGGNKTISNLAINIPQSDSVADYHGFIARNYGTIRQLNFVGIDITASPHHTDKAINVGGVVGTNAGTIYKCTAQDYYIFGNGAVGFCEGATIGSTSWTPTGLYD